LIIANLLPVKGILELLSEMKSYLSQKKNPIAFHLKIVGSATMNRQYADDCLELINDPQLRNVITFLPPMKPADLSNFLARQDILISAAQFESFGMAAWEAVCGGIPVIALRRGNLPHLLSSYKGGMLKPHPNALVKELFELTSDTLKLKKLKLAAFYDRKQNQWKPQKLIHQFYQLIPSFKTENSSQEDKP